MYLFIVSTNYIISKFGKTSMFLNNYVTLTKLVYGFLLYH